MKIHHGVYILISMSACASPTTAAQKKYEPIPPPHVIADSWQTYRPHFVPSGKGTPIKIMVHPSLACPSTGSYSGIPESPTRRCIPPQKFQDAFSGAYPDFDTIEKMIKTIDSCVPPTERLIELGFVATTPTPTAMTIAEEKHLKTVTEAFWNKDCGYIGHPYTAVVDLLVKILGWEDVTKEEKGDMFNTVVVAYKRAIASAFSAGAVNPILVVQDQDALKATVDRISEFERFSIQIE
jgi:hypothetical protein